VKKIDAKRMFIAGYAHGQHALGTSEAIGIQAEQAFEKFWAEKLARSQSQKEWSP